MFYLRQGATPRKGEGSEGSITEGRAAWHNHKKIQKILYEQITYAGRKGEEEERKSSLEGGKVK